MKLSTRFVGHLILLFLSTHFLFAQKPSSGVLQFDGINDYVDIGNSAGNGLRTIEMWFKPDINYNNTMSQIAALLVRNDNFQFGEFGLYIGSTAFPGREGRLVFQRIDNGVSRFIISDSNQWTAGQWYHVAGVIDPVLGMRMYVDGVLQNDTHSSTNPTGTRTEALSIGRWGNTSIRYFDGEIEDVRLWTRALGSLEVQSNMCLDFNSSQQTNLRASWEFEETMGTIAYDSANANNATVYGAQWMNRTIPCTPFSPPPSNGNVLSFDGLDDHVKLGLSVGNGLRTMEMWFKPGINYNQNSPHKAALISRNSSSQLGDFGLYIGSSSSPGKEGHLVFERVESGNTHFVVSNSNSWSIGQWYHIAAVIDPVYGMRLYVDGVLQSDQNPTISPTAILSEETSIGRAGNLSNSHFSGNIENVRFWTRALNSSEIIAKRCILNLDPSQEIGLKANWRFNEGIGNIATDSSSNNNPGNIAGASFVVDSIACLGNPLPAVPFGNVLSFDGQNDYVDLGSSVGNNIRSIELWFKPEVNYNQNTSEIAALIVRNDVLNSNEFGLYIGSMAFPGREGRLVFQRIINGNSHFIISDTNSWNAGQWYHVAGVIDPINGMKLYVDGVLQVDQNSTTSPSSVSTEKTSFGRWGNGDLRYFQGDIENARIWDRALSQTEIDSKKCISLDPALETGLKANWKFNEGWFTIAFDTTSNNFNGSIYGATYAFDSIACTGNPNPPVASGNVLKFDGQDDYVKIGDSVATHIRSIEFWFKPSIDYSNSLIENTGLIYRNDNFQFGDFGIYIGSSSSNGMEGRLVFQNTINGNSNSIVSDSSYWKAGTWYHVAGVLDPNTGMKLFVNGVEQMDNNPQTGAIMANGESTYIGKFGNSNFGFFQGSLENIRLWDRAVSKAAILLKMCSELNPALENGLKANYLLNEGFGTMFYHSGSGAYSGMMFGPIWQNDSVTCTPTGFSLNETISQLTLDIYPNPSSNILNLKFNNENLENAIIAIFSMDGKKLSTTKLDKLSKSGLVYKMEVENLKSGMYLMEIVVPGFPKTSRLIAIQ